MRVHLGSDHAGLDLKAHLTDWLTEHGYEPVDHGPFVFDAVDDYPVFCLRAAEAVARERAEGLDSLGVVIGGSGNGEQMAANKVAGIRCALAWSEETASLARREGIPLVTLAEAGTLELTVDGADEVDPNLDLIKGYGRALVREKIVAASSRRLVILVGEEKLVPQLGTRGKLPVEVVPFALPLCERRLGELGWLIHRQGLIYNEQFGWNIEFEALIAGIYSQYQTAPDTPAKDLWVAEQDGRIVGSIFVMPSDGLPGSAQLRMLYVEPAARGQGLGAALVAQAVSFARGNGYERMRLWTHTNQESARKVYAAAGFVIVETMPEKNFGKELNGEIWEMRF